MSVVTKASSFLYSTPEAHSEVLTTHPARPCCPGAPSSENVAYFPGCEYADHTPLTLVLVDTHSYLYTLVTPV